MQPSDESQLKAKNYWKIVFEQFLKYRMGVAAAVFVILFSLIGLYAPFLASSKPIVVRYEGEWFFPLFRYLLYSGFYTKRVDLFFNLLLLFFPFLVLLAVSPYRGKKSLWISLTLLFAGFFIAFGFFVKKDPALDLSLLAKRKAALHTLREKEEYPSWAWELQFKTPYQKLLLVVDYVEMKKMHDHLVAKYGNTYAKRAKKFWLDNQIRIIKRQNTNLSNKEAIQKVNQESEDLLKEQQLPTQWQRQEWTRQKQLQRLYKQLKRTDEKDPEADYLKAQIRYFEEKKLWLEAHASKVSFLFMPLLRPYHWEDDAGGDQSLNASVSWWEVTRINSKDLLSSLLFGIRVSLMVGTLAVGISLLAGIPIGVAAGYYGGAVDIIISRILEVWEALPVFFMLLFVVAITQSKSIFLVISILGIFGWTGFARYIRGEVLKQRRLPYVLACRSLGYHDRRIMFSHILPNAIPPILTLIPFSIMAAMTSEAGLSFLGLGEEGSASWGVLMDEGRRAFPGESYLLWPPAIALTLLLVAIALVGNALRDAFDPKMHRD